MIDDALSLTMGTTGVLFELGSTVEIDYEIDALDDARRDEYIKTSKEAIERLQKFAEQFNDKTFYNWVKRYTNFLKADLEKQLYYEDLSDQLRDKLYKNITNKKEQLRNENHSFEQKLFQKSFKESRDVG
ncbi:MAG: hypothetical protein ACRCZI_14665 [Cetobacterium sp.]